MKYISFLLLAWSLVACSVLAQGADDVAPASSTARHLFILSGQSNMARLDPAESFTPALEKEFGEENILIVKDAVGGKSISLWYKLVKDADGNTSATTGELYESLMTKVTSATQGQTFDTVTFVWIQGERDASAKEKKGPIYAESLAGLVAQIEKDLGRKEMNVVIGRINDFGNDKEEGFPHWMMIREIQVQFAESRETAKWVDSDDLNGPKNGIHATKPGYKILGERLAAAAIELIKAHSKDE